MIIMLLNLGAHKCYSVRPCQKKKKRYSLFHFSVSVLDVLSRNKTGSSSLSLLCFKVHEKIENVNVHFYFFLVRAQTIAPLFAALYAAQL